MCDAATKTLLRRLNVQLAIASRSPDPFSWDRTPILSEGIPSGQKGSRKKGPDTFSSSIIAATAKRKEGIFRRQGPFVNGFPKKTPDSFFHIKKKGPDLFSTTSICAPQTTGNVPVAFPSSCVPSIIPYSASLVRLHLSIRHPATFHIVRILG